MRLRIVPFLIVAAGLFGCADAGTPPPEVVPAGEERFLIDPRIGYTPVPSPATNRRFEAAWRLFLTGQTEEARRRMAAVRERDPGFVPAQLAEAAIALRQGRTADARAIVERIREASERYTAADIYAAEIAMTEKETRRAYEIYRDVVSRTDAPAVARERLADLEHRLFNEVFEAAQRAPAPEAIRLLREALALNPAATAARIQLVQKLIGQREFDEARRALEPLVTADAGRSEVQEALAEIDVGRGQYEEAIARYERLARREPRYTKRLDEVKQEWIASNMPPQFRRALDAQSLTRGDFAVLAYWKVGSVRFAQNLGTPPIAVDVDVPGREELIRAIALGILQVDPVTRRVAPFGTVTTAGLARLAARVLFVRGAPCARSVPAEPSEAARVQKILAACNVSDPARATDPDAPASGQMAAALLEQVDRALR